MSHCGNGVQRKKCLLGRGVPEEVTKKRRVKKRKRRPFYPSIAKSKATSYEAIDPLSSEVTALLQPDGGTSAMDRPAEPLKRLIKESSCLAKMGMSSSYFASKLNDRIAVKVLGDCQVNHCLAVRCLNEHAPELPVPELHGLIQYDSWSILFMSYVPGSTLTKIWPTLDVHQMASIHGQLNEIFVKVRQIKRQNRPFGLLHGRGVIDLRRMHDEFEASEPIHTMAEFEEFFSSYRPWVKNTYVQLLKTLLPASRFEEECVLTHCDVRKANIVADVDKNSGECRVSGIIDWEEAGFYPAYWGSGKIDQVFLS